MSFSSTSLLEETRLDLRSLLVINGFGPKAVAVATKHNKSGKVSRYRIKARRLEGTEAASLRNKPLKAIHTGDLEVDSDRTSVWDSDSQCSDTSLSKWRSCPDSLNNNYHSNYRDTLRFDICDNKVNLTFGGPDHKVLNKARSRVHDETNNTMNFNSNNDQTASSEHETKRDKFDSHLERLLRSEGTTTSRDTAMNSLSSDDSFHAYDRERCLKREKRRKKTNKNTASDQESIAPRSSSPSIPCSDSSGFTPSECLDMENLSSVTPSIVEYHSETPSVSSCLNTSARCVVPGVSCSLAYIMPVTQTQDTTQRCLPRLCMTYQNDACVPSTVSVLHSSARQVTDKAPQPVENEPEKGTLQCTEPCTQSVLTTEQCAPLSDIYKDKFTGRLHYFLQLQTLENEVKEKDQTLKQLTMALKNKERAHEVSISAKKCSSLFIGETGVVVRT